MKLDWRFFTHLWFLLSLHKITCSGSKGVLEGCFTLTGMRSRPDFAFDKVPKYVELTFPCDMRNQYVRVESVQYSFPAKFDKFCPFNNCPDENTECSCCMKENELCVYNEENSRVQIINEQCRGQDVQCRYSFPRKTLNKVPVNCPSSRDNDCKKPETCYSRWIDVTYQCVQIEAPGSPPKNVKAIPHGNASVQITWDEPTQFNGPIKSYKVYYTTDPSQNVVHWTQRVVYGQTSVDLPKLPINRQYTIRVSASTMAGVGPLSPMVNVTTGLGDVPTKKPSTTESVLTSVLTSTRNTPNDKASHEADKLSGKLWIIGLIIGIVVFIAMVIVVACLIKWRRSTNSDDRAHINPKNQPIHYDDRVYSELNINDQSPTDRPPVPPPRNGPLAWASTPDHRTDQTLPKSTYADQTALKVNQDSQHVNSNGYPLKTLDHSTDQSLLPKFQIDTDETSVKGVENSVESSANQDSYPLDTLDDVDSNKDANYLTVVDTEEDTASPAAGQTSLFNSHNTYTGDSNNKTAVSPSNNNDKSDVNKTKNKQRKTSSNNGSDNEAAKNLLGKSDMDNDSMRSEHATGEYQSLNPETRSDMNSGVYEATL